MHKIDWKLSLSCSQCYRHLEYLMVFTGSSSFSRSMNGESIKKILSSGVVGSSESSRPRLLSLFTSLLSTSIVASESGPGLAGSENSNVKRFISANHSFFTLWQKTMSIPPLKTPRQSFGTFEAHRLWQLNLQSGRHITWFITRLYVYGLVWRSERGIRTLTLHALTEESFQQFFTVLTDGGPGVVVNDKSVRHLHPPKYHLLHPDGPSTPWGDTLAWLQKGALLRE